MKFTISFFTVQRSCSGQCDAEFSGNYTKECQCHKYCHWFDNCCHDMRCECPQNAPSTYFCRHCMINNKDKCIYIKFFCKWNWNNLNILSLTCVFHTRGWRFEWSFSKKCHWFQWKHLKKTQIVLGHTFFKS